MSARPILSRSFGHTPFAYVPMDSAVRRALLLDGISTVLDVGANAGQYSSWLRSLGFAGRIVSFEPQASAFQDLAAVSAHDPLWECRRAALGASDGELELHLASDTCATSVFAPTPAHMANFPGCVSTGHVEVGPVYALSSLWGDLGCVGAVYLKIDVEGSEMRVLSGAAPVLDEITFLEIELSVTPMYERAPLLGDVMSWLSAHGFQAVAIEPNGGDDPATGFQHMCDGIFWNVGGQR